MTTRERGSDVKSNTYREGALLFHSFLQNGKVVEELLEFIGIELTNLSTLRCSDL